MVKNSILAVVPIVMAANLAEHNYSSLKKKKKKPVKLAVENIVGVSLIGELY